MHPKKGFKILHAKSLLQGASRRGRRGVVLLLESQSRLREVAWLLGVLVLVL